MRADWKSGRFSTAYHAARIDAGLRAWQHRKGDVLAWFRAAPAQSHGHDVYDEGAAPGGRAYHPPITVPVLDVSRDQGAVERTAQGLYQVAPLYVTAAARQLARVGISQPDIDTHRYLRDWIGYDGRLHRIDELQALGRLRRHDFVVSLKLTEIKPDELTADAQFDEYRRFGLRHIRQPR
ncbi:hypothetical protein AB0B15_03240 [Streptomyces sp. NPDC045456]|uniref:hypothetical protein n=1 Tax=Streptomyces sp. NPDC045456 TaxID=3155254 RepID=UPI0033C7EBED